MNRYQLVLAQPEGFVFVEAFREVMESLQAAFTELGIPCDIGASGIEAGVTPILFGAHHLDAESVARLPADTIVYNMEQLLPGYPWYSPGYLALLGRFRVWDTHLANIELLRRMGIGHALHLPVGYMPLLDRIPVREPDVDVLFCGVMTRHRQDILEAIARLDIKVMHLNGIFGAERDEWIGRSRLVLNLHQRPGGLLETPRLAYLLANRKAVVSEDGDYRPEDGIYEGFASATAESIPALCRTLLDRPGERAALAERGRAEITTPARRTTRLLDALLKHEVMSPGSVLPSTGLSGVARSVLADPVQTSPAMDAVLPGLARGKSGFGINLIGNLTAGVGLGMATRAIAAHLGRLGVPFSLLDVPHAWGRPQDVSEFARYQVTVLEALEHPVNLYVLPVSYYASLFETNPLLTAAPRLHVANVWWESAQFPQPWIDTLSRFDAVLALSDFIADTCRNSLPMTPTVAGAYPLELPAGTDEGRSGFGVPEDAVLFVASLDPNSDPARKNPAALVTAFRHAFDAGDDGVRFLIRLNNADTELGRATIAELNSLIGSDERIRLLLGECSHARILSLYACADVYVSLHRAEGLGLGMLEAMTLGTAVIATGWSGNLSFMDHSNSALVRYRLVPVHGHYDFFQPSVIGGNARWADPVLEDAVAWMRLLRSNGALRSSLAEQGRKSALDYRDRAVAGRWVREISDLWQFGRHLPGVVEKYSYRSPGGPRA